MEIRDGYWHKSPVIQRLCGNHSAVTVRSDSSRMLISYVNRRSVKGFRGFIADFEGKFPGLKFIYFLRNFAQILRKIFSSICLN